jgi:hypothetical protein
VTLGATGGFNAPQGTAAITYTVPGGGNSATTSVASGAGVYAITQTIAGASIS